MVISCVVVGCTSRFKKGSGLKFHWIPPEDGNGSKPLTAKTGLLNTVESEKYANPVSSCMI